jgi:UDP-3-O-[3-hydroxymyristoyl] glucosamine N-acyltransferase
MIGAQSGVTKSLGRGSWLLSPAVPIEKAGDQIAWVRRLGKLYARVKALEAKEEK